MDQMFAKMLKKPGRYTVVVDNNLDLQSVTYNVDDMAGTYTIVLDNKLKILSMTHNGKLMTNMSALDPNDNDYIDPDDKKYKPEGFEKNPATGKFIVPGKLKHGCVGLGMISESLTQTDPCQWYWDRWW